MDLAKILVADDDPAAQMTIRLMLERAGHSVIVASDGEMGLATFETADFDLLLPDIYRPGMDGLETMRLIHRQRPTIPAKPIKPTDLLATVEDCLAATQGSPQLARGRDVASGR
jgi:CheY-like chemotaxis protein